MIQAGPVANVHMPKDKVTGVHQGFGFVEFRSEDDAEYAIKVRYTNKWGILHRVVDTPWKGAIHGFSATSGSVESSG